MGRGLLYRVIEIFQYWIVVMAVPMDILKQWTVHFKWVYCMQVNYIRKFLKKKKKAQKPVVEGDEHCLLLLIPASKVADPWPSFSSALS